MGKPGFKRILRSGYCIDTITPLLFFINKTKRTEEMIHPLRCVLFETILLSL